MQIVSQSKEGKYSNTDKIYFIQIPLTGMPVSPIKYLYYSFCVF